MDVSVVIPCLDEAQSVREVVRAARDVISEAGLEGEVIVSDDGSDDGSIELAVEAGARVVGGGIRTGAGAATARGVSAAKGAWLVFLDADGEHDPADMQRFFPVLEEDDRRLVLGSRYRGRFLKGASSFVNRRLGTPALTALINHLFGTEITDCNTGFRAINRDLYGALKVRSTGFEYCSEMIIRAALLKVPIVEVPITQYPGPVGRIPRLRRFRDGWRHLKSILLHAPDSVLLRPGVALLVAGALFFFRSYRADSSSGGSFLIFI